MKFKLFFWGLVVLQSAILTFELLLWRDNPGNPLFAFTTIFVFAMWIYCLRMAIKWM